MPLTLTLLGGFGADAHDGPSTLASRKARAVVAALALARHRTLGRERLAALLWATSDPEQGRASLRQALVQVRRAGIGIETSGADTVALFPDIAIDVDAFGEALAGGRAAEAIRLYRGDLLEGLTFRDPVIERWLEGERSRLRGLAARALVAELDRLGERPEATPLAHRLLGLDPLHERAYRTLMRLDAARGETRAALARFAALGQLLRRELDTEPEAETTALAHSIRLGRGGGTPSGAAADVPPRSAPPADVHLRQVVVLAALGAEEPADGDWTDALAETLTAAGGELVRREDDELVAVWGWHRTREADARAAADLARVAADRLGPRASFGLAEAAVVSDGGDAALGRAGRRAVRLAAAASPGTVATEPRLAERLARPDRPAPALVGRCAELDQMLGVARAALAHGTGAVLHVAGEAGIGKTRLAHELAERLAREGLETAAIGFDAFGDAVHPGRRLAAALPHRAPPAMEDPFDRAVLAALSGRALEVGDRLRLEALSPDERLRRDLRVTEALVAEAADPNGLFLLVEDCHWAGHVESSYLLELADATARLPLVMLLTERPGEHDLAPRLAARGRTALVRIVASPLTPAAAEALARSIGVDARRTERALALAGGHPLFLLRLLEAELDDERLPSTVGALVQEQIERLPVAARTALRRASILGRRFAPEDFRAVFDAPPPGPNGDLLVADGERLAFGHELVHRAVRESVPEALRARWHARAAAHHRARDPLRWADHALVSDDDAEASRAAAAAANALISARRFRGALPYVEAGIARGGDPEALAELHSCRAAVRRAHGDPHGALGDYRAAYAHAIDHATQASMLARTALVLNRLGLPADAASALDDAERIADRSGLGGTVRAEIHEQRGNIAFLESDHEACARHHAVALAAVELVGDERAIARAHGGLGDAAFAAGRMRTACAHYERAIAEARRGGFGLVVEEFGQTHAHALHFADPGPRASALVDLAVESAEASGGSRTELLARLVRAGVRLCALDLDGVEGDLDRVARLSSANDEPYFAGWATGMRALLAYRRGSREAADGLIRPGVEAGSLAGHATGLQLGVAALVAADASVRRRAVELGTGAARRSWLAHGALWFDRLALESALAHGDVALARDRVGALRERTADEPLGWVDLAIENAQWQLASSDAGVSPSAFVARTRAAGMRDLGPPGSP